MYKWQKIEQLYQSGLIAVVRRPKFEQVFDIAEALVAGGVGALEVTLDTDRALDIIYELKNRYGDEVLVGAGTVLDAPSAKMAIDAQSDFIFSPNYNVEMIQMTNRYGRISIPGVMTPSEAVEAYAAGADILKVFPGGALGASFIKDLQGPLAHIPVMPTGGVTVENTAQFIQNGAIAIGVGGSLMNEEAIRTQNYAQLTKIARQFSEQIKKARAE
ncbi:MAG TPA: bifunctional 4-hydroxy-2-oxoglutarate aldolase/2-dehydro-3-deoxy-phosphogluconate aldolase [Savagea sp.]